jgi:hypothetical protein
MTNEDEKIVADYMDWYYAGHEGIYYYDWDGRRQRNLDLTAAGLVVQEMQKRGEWQDFVQTAAKIHKLGFHSEVVAWLFSAENFLMS